MGHDGMPGTSPSGKLIADCVDYMANALCTDAVVRIWNSEKITPGMRIVATRTRTANMA